jgi:hypothetical protein
MPPASSAAYNASLYQGLTGGLGLSATSVSQMTAPLRRQSFSGPTHLMNAQLNPYAAAAAAAAAANAADYIQRKVCTYLRF